MKLRWKFFIVLLVASLVPMTMVTLFSQRASQKLGYSVAMQTQQVLEETVRGEIISATENYAMITLRAKSSLEFALQALIREAETFLTLPTPELEKIYFVEDFDNPETAPIDLAQSMIHMEILEDGRMMPKMISKDHPNMLLAPGIKRSDVHEDIARLTRLAPALKGIAAEIGTEIFWIYASLESGIHMSYPGHGGYPDDYDPRLRPWYIRAEEHGEGPTWGAPIVDTTTKQLTFTVSAPFFKIDGSLAGVAAIDVLIPNVLLESQISSQWSKNMQSFLVGQSSFSDEDQDHLWVISKKEKLGQTANEHQTWESEMYRGDKLQKFAQLTKHFKDNKSGSVEMDFQGVPSFWAFAPIFPNLHFVIIAPKSMVLELSEEVGDRFLSYTRGQRTISIIAVIVVILIVAGIALIVSRTSTNNIMSIVSEFKQLERGDFSVRLSPKFNDERDRIVTTFNQIIPRLEEHLRMSRALGVAKEVQQSLLPHGNPILQGFDIAGTSVYCEETGGDYYDFIPIGENHLAVVVGDVSGHGVSSALLMATARALVMLRASMPGSAANIINDVNKQLSLDTSDTGNFMTFFYCELAATSREVRWVRAGHDPALLYDPATDEFSELKGHGVALGLDYSFEYEDFQQKLGPNQIIVIGTDGIWEMRNQAGEMFGKESLMEIIRLNNSAPAIEILTAMIDRLKDFRGNAQPEDDVTIVVIKVEE